MDRSVDVEVLVEAHVFLELEARGEGLLADCAYGADLASVGADVVKEVLTLAEDVIAEVAAVLDAPLVDRDVLAEAVEAGELAAADRAAVEAPLVLRADVRKVGHHEIVLRLCISFFRSS